MKRLPDYIHRFRDRHGRVRYYFRRAGFRRVPLPGPPFSQDFLDAYAAALAGKSAPIEIGAKRTQPGTVTAAVVSYFNSGAFQSLAPETKRTRRNTLERFRAEHGDKRVALLQRFHIERLLDARAATPFMARNFLKAIRGLMQHCVKDNLRTDDPTQGVKATKIPRDRQGGFATWTEAEIATFEAKYPVGSRARLAFGLLLYTGQRRADVVRMGRQMIEGDYIRVRQQKTGRELSVPIHRDLNTILGAAPTDNLTFLVTEHGRPFSPAGFTNLFRRWVKAAGLRKGISEHGLRKACCRRLAEAGCTAPQIAAISGHLSLREVQRYIDAADQQTMARQAMDIVSGAKSGTSSGKP